MSSELPSNDIIETLALNANAILAPDEVVVKRATAEKMKGHLKIERRYCVISPDWAEPIIADLTAALEREVKA